MNCINNVSSSKLKALTTNYLVLRWVRLIQGRSQANCLSFHSRAFFRKTIFLCSERVFRLKFECFHASFETEKCSSLEICLKSFKFSLLPRFLLVMIIQVFNEVLILQQVKKAFPKSRLDINQVVSVHGTKSHSHLVNVFHFPSSAIVTKELMKSNDTEHISSSNICFRPG